MENLQNLYDYYIKTKPSEGKIRTATTLLIRICKALNIDAPEEISREMFKQIPLALDEYYGTNTYKALQDKSMLAEMIGRYGPRDNWEEVIDNLLNDSDSNLKQYTLQSLAYSGFRDPLPILPYIRRFVNSKDTDLKSVSAGILCKWLTSEHSDLVFEQIKSWPLKDNIVFLEELRECLKKSNEHKINPEFLKWLSQFAD